ncbi:hypothetical protein IV203_022547 [Nitzschia inconspicua]|uniref:SBF1/SBF2 domain-containing protein n=1 Tax=Nitzschia inconspicua TaxID=303405 RepID=A0A9K3KIW2_9STRA|nr:hypothetical protein IV203_022547 [Nitzschia inconspicua]
MFRRFLRTGTSFNQTDGNDSPNAGVGSAQRSSVVAEGDPPAATSTTTTTTTTFSLMDTIKAKTQQTSKSASWKAHEKLKEVLANTMKVEELINFDSCVEAADSLAATAATGSAAQSVDPSTGLVDCSVLVSPEGELLVVPQLQHHHQQQQQQQQQESKSPPHQLKYPPIRSTGSTDKSSVSKKLSPLEETAQAFWATVRTNELGDEYQSAVFLGQDLHQNGDKILNRFSAKGWSMPATSLALKQSTDAMNTLKQTVEKIAGTKQSTLQMEKKQVVDKLLTMVTEAPTMSEAQVKKYQRYWQSTFPDETRMEVSASRVGPFSSSGSTIQVALVALQNYYASCNETDAELWNSFTNPEFGALTRFQQATAVAEERVKNRQIALQEMIRRTKAMEQELSSCKEEAKKRWDQVHAAEVKVTELVEEKRLERTRLREQQRLELIKQDSSTQAAEGTTNASEIWDIVSAVTAEMDEGSFAPMDLPQLPMDRARSADSSDKGSLIGDVDSEDLETSTQTSMATRLELEEMRYDLEEEVGLLQLRRAALSAEEAVENVANSLLSVLSNLDSTSRSARLASQTCLVSAGNAQAACLRSLVQLERASIAQRLEQLEELENAAKEIDVRADLDQYIAMDKDLPCGRSFLGDDDDGGMASALAVLNEHTDGDIGNDMNRERTESSIPEDDDEVDNESAITPEYLETAIDSFFQNNPNLLASAPITEKTKKAQKDLETTIQLLCKIGRDKSYKSKTKRSTICFTMNAKRSADARIPSKLQFDGLCSVFSAVLSGCTTDPRGVSNAKVLMNLSQHFYFQGEKDKDRTHRKEIYIKSRIAKHPMWEKDEFWDHALNQAVGESLAHSGVMANFERASNKILTSTNKKRSEWTQTHKTRWHDLTVEERYEAASQVHAVVFAQLSAMMHTMEDFGCSLQQTSSFVRRMCIRNRLPMSQRTALLRHLIQSGKKTNSISTSTTPRSLAGSSAARRSPGQLPMKK